LRNSSDLWIVSENSMPKYRLTRVDFKLSPGMCGIQGQALRRRSVHDKCVRTVSDEMFKLWVIIGSETHELFDRMAWAWTMRLCQQSIPRCFHFETHRFHCGSCESIGRPSYTNMLLLHQYCRRETEMFWSECVSSSKNWITMHCLFVTFIDTCLFRDVSKCLMLLNIQCHSSSLKRVTEKRNIIDIRSWHLDIAR
jgi:hypothetical protein